MDEMHDQSRDTIINLLKRTIEERDREIEMLFKQKNDLEYFIQIHFDSMKKILRRDEDAIRGVKEGMLSKPTLVVEYNPEDVA